MGRQPQPQKQAQQRTVSETTRKGTKTITKIEIEVRHQEADNKKNNITTKRTKTHPKVPQMNSTKQRLTNEDL